MNLRTSTSPRQSIGQMLKELRPGTFLTLESRLPRGGSLQARKLSTGAVQFYWRYSHQGSTSREPIGTYDPLAPPRKLEATTKGYSVSAALEKCDLLAKTHAERVNTGGLKIAKQEEREKFAAAAQAVVAKQAQTLGKLLETYVSHLKAQQRRSHYDAYSIFELHVKEAWPKRWAMPAADVTPEHVLDMLRKLIEGGKGRTANKLRSYLRAAYQCAIDVRSTASIPVAFKSFNVIYNPVAQTKREGKFDRADKRPLTLEELRAYWLLIHDVPDVAGAALRIHLLTGGQRIEQLVRLRWQDVTDDRITIFDGKGRPGGQGPRPHTLPLIERAASAFATLTREGEYVLSTSHGKKPISQSSLSKWAHEVVKDSIDGFQLKRIRSGVETILAANGVSRELRGHLQSHGQTGVQARHYDGHDYMPEKRNALELLSRLLTLKGRSRGEPNNRSSGNQRLRSKS